ncbi:uncharacterized protein ACRADG_004831 [Cochliomyia hominivorax]
MSGIDRVLYLFGGRKIQKYFNSGCSCVESSGKEDYCCCNRKRMECKENKLYHNYSSDRCSLRNTPTYSVLQKCDDCSQKSLNFKKSSLSHRSSITPRMSNVCRQDNGKVGIPLRLLKRSFSLCSLACRKLKEKLIFTPTPNLAMPIISPQWLWTKVENYADGCQVYEIFKNSNASSHPTKFDTSRASKIIFVILPTGIIMPFETLARH